MLTQPAPCVPKPLCNSWQDLCAARLSSYHSALLCKPVGSLPACTWRPNVSEANQCASDPPRKSGHAVSAATGGKEGTSCRSPCLSQASCNGFCPRKPCDNASCHLAELSSSRWKTSHVSESLAFIVATVVPIMSYADLAPLCAVGDWQTKSFASLVCTSNDCSRDLKVPSVIKASPDASAEPWRFPVNGGRHAALCLPENLAAHGALTCKLCVAQGWPRLKHICECSSCLRHMRKESVNLGINADQGTSQQGFVKICSLRFCRQVALLIQNLVFPSGKHLKQI